MSSNLQEDAKKVISALKVTRNAAQMGSAVTSVMIIWIIAFSKAQEFLPPWGAGLLAVFIVALALGVMELGLRIFLPFALDEILAGRAWNEEGKINSAYRVSFWIFCLALCAALAFGTGGTSWLGRIDMIEAASPPPEVADLNQVRIDQDAERSRIYEKYEQEILAARKSHRQRVKDAQSTAKKMLNEAKRSKGAKMYQLFESGNSWAAQQLSAAIKKAQQTGNALIEAEKGKVKRLTAEQASTLSNLSAGQQEVFDKISQQTESTISRFDSKFERNTLMLGIFGVGCLALFILTNILLSIYRVLSGVPTFEDKPKKELNLPLDWLPTFSMPGRTAPMAKSTQPIGFKIDEQSGKVTYGQDEKLPISRHPEQDAFSGKDTDSAGNFWAKDTDLNQSYRNPPVEKQAERYPSDPVQIKVKDVPDNTNKSYKKRKDVRERERLIRATWNTFLTENGKPPTMQLLSRATGIGYKTTRKIVDNLGLRDQ